MGPAADGFGWSRPPRRATMDPLSQKTRDPKTTHRVFVDFENVPSVDLGEIGGQPIAVTLLLGKSQRRLDVGLVQQIRRHASQIELIEMDASGRNALDLALAYHLGRAAVAHPGDCFHIISRDRDFEPLMAHLRHAGVGVFRHDAFGVPAVLGAARPARRTERRPAASDKATIVLNRLRKASAGRPTRMSTLLSHVKAQFAEPLAEGEAESIVRSLVERGAVAVDTRNRVTYPEPPVAS